MTTRIDSRVEFRPEMRELYEPFIEAINRCIYAEQIRCPQYTDELVTKETWLKLPDQSVSLDVSDCEFVPREVRGFIHGLEWLAIMDYDASHEVAEWRRKYVAVFAVQQV